MKYVWITILFLSVVFSANGQYAVQQFRPLPDAEVEEIMLQKVKGAVREGKILKLQTNTGTATFEDRLSSGEGFARYYLAGYRDNQGFFYLVRVYGYEGQGYMLVDKKSGQIIDLFGKPVFSPDGEKFVAVSLDLDAGYVPNLICIYELKGHQYSKAWEYIYQGAKGPASPVWLNDSAVVYFEVTFDKVPTFANFKKKPYVIERVKDKWRKPRLLN
jgi:hypothetical protein